MSLTEGMIGKTLRVKMASGKEYEGVCVEYIPAKDNDPEIDSIWIQKSKDEADELFENHIVSVEILNNGKRTMIG
ncbi:MAG: hypothetical protein J6A79_07805 [Clostridia bacterium]|nr:hypothetical protein [Clostridia bacterium]